MEKFEIGEYVKTKKGKIGKVLSIDEDPEWIETTLDKGNVMHISEFKKHSKQLIDLIEVGDYVNGEKIEQITTDSGYKKYYTTGFGVYDEYDNESVIHSILTKEQYEANCYRVKEE